jgi:hypothetical protein
MKELRLDKDLRKMKFHLNIFKRSMLNMKIGSKLTILKKSLLLTQLKISNWIKLKLPI